MRFFTALTILALPLLSLAAPVKEHRKRASDNDFLVLQFARVLELLETAFYTQALQKFTAADFTTAGFQDPNVPIQQILSIQAHESTHITALEGTLTALGQTLIPGCTFDFSPVLPDVKTMLAVARTLEAVGVSAYLGGAQLLTDVEVLAAAASIVTIEASHSTILNILNLGEASAQAFDIALSPQQVLALAAPFIQGCTLPIQGNVPLTVTSSTPPPPGTSLTFSSPGIDAAVAAGQNLSCQMLVGGAPTALSFPIDQCIPPPGLLGPVYVFVTNTSQPLLSDLKNQFGGSVVTGPALLFLDGTPEALAVNARAVGPISAPAGPAAPAPSPPPAAPPVDNSAQSITVSSIITPQQASSILGAPQPTGSVQSGPPVGVRRRRSIERRGLPARVDAEIW